MELPQLEKKFLQYNDKLAHKLADLPELIENAAQTERDYRVELAKEIIIQKSKGVLATNMSDIVRGQPHIADLKFQRDVAKGIADASKQAIRSIQSTMSGLQSLISTRKAEMNLR